MNKYLGAYEFIELCVRPWEHSTDELDRPVMNTQKQDNMNILKELVDKATPKKAIKLKQKQNGYTHECPTCHKYVGTIIYDGVEHDDYCPSCGQRLDWGDDDDR